MTASRWLMFLNDLDPSEDSTVLGGDDIRYTRALTPAVQYHARCPEGMSIAHFMLDQEQKEQLMEDWAEWDAEKKEQLPFLEITTAKLARLFLVSHWPRRIRTPEKETMEGRGKGKGEQSQKHRQQANVIANNLRAFLKNDRSVEELIVWSRFEVLLCLHPTTNPQQLAAQLRNWDDYTLASMHDRSTVRITTMRMVQHPPHLWIVFPATLSIAFLTKRLATILDIDDYQVGVNHGELLLHLTSTEACLKLQGCRISCGEYGQALLTSGDEQQDALECQRQGLRPESTIEERLEGVER